jgi:hypothetical protein
MPLNKTSNAEGTVSEQGWERRPERRVHLSEAAEILGVSKDAVRMRVKRGTLRSEKGEDGRVYVWMNVIPDADPNCVHPQGEVDPYRELVEELRDRVRSLEEANRENRRIIAALTSRIPAIEALQDASEAAEPRSEGPLPLPRRSPALRSPQSECHGGGGCSVARPLRLDEVRGFEYIEVSERP